MTSKHDQLLTFYTQVMGSLDFAVDDNGLLHYTPTGAVDKDGVSQLYIPAFIEGKRWVMPTTAILDLSPWEENIAFHPLSQNVNNGESENVNKLQSAINLRLNRTVAELLFHLTEFAALPEKQNMEVSAKASKYRQLVPDLKAISVERMEQMMAKAASSEDHRFVNLYLKRSAEVEGTRYLRAGIINFPFREELDGKEAKVFGVTMSKKDQASFRALFDYILPNNAEIDTYSAGSSHSHAPSMDALLKAYLKVAERLNGIITTHKKILPEYKSLHIDTSWAETMPLLAKLADVIPPLPGNVGEPMRDGRTEGAISAKAPVKVATAAKAQSKFQDTEKRTTPSRELEVEQVKAAATAQDEDDAVAKTGLSFAERMAARRGGTPAAAGYGAPTSRYAQPASAGRYGAQSPANSRYGAPVEPPVPEWAKKGEKSMTIAGDPNPPSAYAQGSRFGARQAQQHTGPTTSFSERFRGQQGRYGNTGGGFRI